MVEYLTRELCVQNEGASGKSNTIQLAHVCVEADQHLHGSADRDKQVTGSVSATDANYMLHAAGVHKGI
jgi:hypothetical protein